LPLEHERKTPVKRLAFVKIVSVVAVLGAAIPGYAHAKDSARDEKELLQIERDWVKASATKDAAALGKILGDDWVMQGPLGTMKKAEVLADLKSGDSKIESITLGDMSVRVFGDTAIVMGSNDEKSSYKGKDTSGRYTWVDVFVKRKGHWQAVASQGTLMPAAR
jgi:ketosteroid isomerase-like protein